MMVINHLKSKKMKKYYILLFALVGVLGFFSSCDEDGDHVVLRENVIAPTIKTLPDLSLVRANGTETLVFACTPVDPGFTASASYFLEACPENNNFENVTQLYNGVTCDNIEFTINELNSILLNGFAEDQTSSVDFRIRCVLETDAGLGVDDHVYYSETVNGDATIFGLLRLDILISGSETQKIVSLASDGAYEGFVKFDAGDSFTLLDPDNNITYGAGTTGMAVDGSAITVTEAGWYKLQANTVGLTIDNLKYLVGIVGVVNGWAAPDLAMEYDLTGKFWYRNGVVLPDGGVKFRHNEDWNNDFNLGVVDNTAPDLDHLFNAGTSQDIVMTAGTYDIKLWLDLTSDTGSKATITPVE